MNKQLILIAKEFLITAPITTLSNLINLSPNNFENKTHKNKAKIL